MINFFKKLWTKKARKAKEPADKANNRRSGSEFFEHHKGKMLVFGPTYEVRFGVVYKVFKVVMLEEDPEMVLSQLLDKLEQEKAVLRYFERDRNLQMILVQKRAISHLNQIIQQQYAQCPQPDLSKILPHNIITHD